MKYLSYYKASSLSDAEEALRKAEGRVLLLAGGTDVLVLAREDNPYEDCRIIDIYGLPEISAIEDRGDTIRIGAGATHQMIAENELVQKYGKVLSDACASIGSLQIRNHATIGGNVGRGSPAADTLAPLSVLKADVIVDHLGEQRTIAFDKLFKGQNKTVLSDRDLILAIEFKKLPEGTRTNFTKIGRRKSLAVSRMTIAAILSFDDSGIVSDFCMTMGATFPVPMIFPDVNEMLIGKKPSSEDISLIAEKLSAKIPEIAGIRASTAYKQPVCRNLCARILHEMMGGGQDNG